MNNLEALTVNFYLFREQPLSVSRYQVTLADISPVGDCIGGACGTRWEGAQ